MGNQFTLKLFDASVPASSSAISTTQRSEGYDHIIVAISNDAVTSASVDILLSYDNVNFNHVETAIPSGTGQFRFAKVNVNAPYIRIRVSNGDTVAHVIKVHGYFVSN